MKFINKKTLQPWLVCLSAAGFFCYEFFQINMFNALDPELIKEFNVSGTKLSFLSSLYFYGTVGLLIPAGILLDKLSTRVLILTAMGLSILGTFLFAISTSFEMAAISRFIVGVSGGPFGFLCTIRLSSRWFPENKLAFVTGIIVSIGMMGGFLSQTPFTILVENIGWRYAIGVDIAVGLILFSILIIFIKDHPADKRFEYLKQQAIYKKMGFIKGLKIVILKLQNWYCGIFASLLNLPIFLLGALWGNLYISQVFNLSRIQASYISSMLYIGMLLGSPFFGYISDKMNLRRMPMLIGAIICLTTIIYVMQQHSLSLETLVILFFIIGFGSSSQILAYPTVAESNHPSMTGSSEGLAAVLIMSGGAFFQPLFGYLLDKNWNGTTINNLPIYSYFDYFNALSLLPVSILISILMIYFIKETNCKNMELNFKKPAIMDI